MRQSATKLMQHAMNQTSVPHLTTAQSGPLHQVEQHIVARQADIESWFRSEWRKTPAPFYASVDLRNSGYKLAPIDTNLFPGGFNNLNPAFEPLCIQAIQSAVERLPAAIDRIVIIPENHTRNRFYLESLTSLRQSIEKAGFEVRYGSIMPDLTEPIVLSLPSGKSLHIAPLQRTGDQVSVDHFVPDLIVVNNDLSSGCPPILESLTQMVVPRLDLGWSNRLKSTHFGHYQAIAKAFGKRIDMDPWLLDPAFRNCGEIDFIQREGNDCLERNVESLLQEIQKKYDEYQIKSQPFVIVKAERGTYGMAIMTVQSTNAITELNRKQRTRMSKTKEGQKVTKVIIQEGVYTHETWRETATVAEPVVYMIDHHVVGGFYRLHEARSVNENLNTPGMRFEPLAFASCCVSPDTDSGSGDHPNRFYAYGVVARLALLAAARESQN